MTLEELKRGIKDELSCYGDSSIAVLAMLDKYLDGLTGRVGVSEANKSHRQFYIGIDLAKNGTSDFSGRS